MGEVEKEEKVEKVINMETKEQADDSELCKDSSDTTVSDVKFSCDLCNFEAKRSTVLKIHMNKKHKDDHYSYWKTDYLGTVYQTYIDAIADIEDCRELSDDEINDEIE